MADVRPFKGLRYQARDITSLVCPPFDVISPAKQAALYAQSPENVIRLELTRDEEGATPASRYQRAADQYGAWLADGTRESEALDIIYTLMSAEA